MAVRRSHKPVSAGRMTRLLGDLLDASALFAIATVSRDGTAYINTAYFAWGKTFQLVWLSESAARHSRNLGDNNSAAVAVFDSNQVWGGPDRGVQLFGSAGEVAGGDLDEAEDIYRRRFPDARPRASMAYRFYALRARRAKLFHEEELGPGVFVTATVAGDGKLAWRRTDIYQPGA